LQRPSRREGLPDLPDLPELITKLDAAYELAMVTKQPGFACKCIELQGRLLGLMVERSAVVHGRMDNAVSLQGDTAENRRRILESMRERFGSEKTQRFLEVLEDKTIDGDNLQHPKRCKRVDF
jgi:hypothetical protein